MEFGIEKWAMLVMKSRKRHLTDGMELPNEEKIWALVEKETNKYFGILEADTIKQVEIKEKLKTSISGKPESYPRQTSIAEILPKGYIPGLSPRKILGAILKVDQKTT